jgi:hypothetical protein
MPAQPSQSKKGGAATPRPGSREAGVLEQQQRQDAFLAAFVEHATVTAAAHAAGIARRTHYWWLETDEGYAKRFKDADDQVTEALEAEAKRRAHVGVSEPVFYKGEAVGTIQKYSDTLLIFLLKARRPDVYRERFDHTLAGPDGAPLVVRWQTDVEAKS